MFLKLVNCAGSPQPLRVTTTGAHKLARRARATILTSTSPDEIRPEAGQRQDATERVRDRQQIPVAVRTRLASSATAE